MCEQISLHACGSRARHLHKRGKAKLLNWLLVPWEKVLRAEEPGGKCRDAPGDECAEQSEGSHTEQRRAPWLHQPCLTSVRRTTVDRSRMVSSAWRRLPSIIVKHRGPAPTPVTTYAQWQQQRVGTEGVSGRALRSVDVLMWSWASRVQNWTKCVTPMEGRARCPAPHEGLLMRPSARNSFLRASVRPFPCAAS